MTVNDDNIKPKFVVGQKVIISPGSVQAVTQREDDISRFAGKVGQIADFYWISPRTGQVFYIYNVKVDDAGKEIVVYEDEMEASLS